MIQVKVFDFEHEEDLQDAVNEFLQTIDASRIIDIKYQVAVAESSISSNTTFCFSAMILYRT